MHPTATIAGLFVLAMALLDAFQTIILPRRPVGRFRVTKLFFASTWSPWRRLALLWPDRAKREQVYSVYGPLSLLFLFMLWASLLLTGFGLVYFGLRLPFHDPVMPDPGPLTQLRASLYFSGTTLFTLGLGDLQPITHVARFLTVVEAGTGLGFIALVIGYVPVLYQAFSNREVLVALLDARAGSPPTASELLQRHSYAGGADELARLMGDWERWCAEILETHISYPILCYYRSQHDNQSWLSALVSVLDACALLVTMQEGLITRQAQLTFAIGRHALVDLVHVFHMEEAERALRERQPSRLRDEEFQRLCARLQGTGFSPCTDLEAHERLAAVRLLYEPYACALSEYLRLPMPLWAPDSDPTRKSDAWTVVSGLRTPATLAERLTLHVSTESTAAHLTDHERE